MNENTLLYLSEAEIKAEANYQLYPSRETREAFAWAKKKRVLYTHLLATLHELNANGQQHIANSAR